MGSCLRCAPDAFADEGCIDGIVYGSCGAGEEWSCYGLCQFQGYCDCECHDEEADEPIDRTL